METFKDIANFEGLYKVSNLGNVIRCIHGSCRPVKPWANVRGYLEVSLSKNGIRKVALLHRIVAKAFLKPDARRTHVNHINEDKSDNRVSNLEWVTAKENDNHGTRNMRISAKSHQTRKYVYVRLNEDGSEAKRYHTHSELRQDGFNVKAISTSCRKGWRHGGHKWLKLILK